MSAPLSPALDRLPPQELDAEQAVIGCLLLDDTGEVAPAVLEIVSPGDFFLKPNGAIYEAILRLYLDEKPTDLLTVTSELKRAGDYDRCGGEAYLIRCQEQVPAYTRGADYAREIEQAATLRRSIDLGGEIIGAAYNGQGIEGVTAQAAALCELLARSDLRRGARAFRPEILTGPEIMARSIPPASWAVDGMVPEGLTLMVGGSKLGKSFLAYQFALGIAGGGYALGKIRVQQGRVLYLALEDSWRRVQARLGMLYEGAEVPEALHVAREWRRPEEGGLSDLRGFLTERPDTRLVIIDTFAALRGVPTSKANVYYLETAEIRQFKAIADHHGCSLLVLHHTNKSKPDDWLDASSGSTGLPGGADGTIMLCRKRGQETAILKRTGRDLDDDSDLAIVWEDHTGWTYRGDAAAYLLSEVQRRVLSAFQAREWEPAATSEVADALGQSDTTTRKQLYRMSVSGLVASRGNGSGALWYVTPSTIENGKQILSQASRASDTGSYVPGVPLKHEGGHGAVP